MTTLTAINQFQEALQTLDKVEADRIFNQALATLSPIEVVERMVVPALEAVGQAWQQGTVALSQVYMSGRFCEDIVERVLPPSDPDRKQQPRSAVVVLNDHHMLGKRIVYSLMRASGFEMYDYGRMDVAELVQRTQDDGVQILLVSVLMLPSALKVRQLRDALKPEIKIAVGGAPFLFDSQLWQEVGADAMGHHAGDAVRIVEGWMREMQ